MITISIPGWLARLIAPLLFKRERLALLDAAAATHGKASINRRSKSGIFEVVIEAARRDDVTP